MFTPPVTLFTEFLPKIALTRTVVDYNRADRMRERNDPKSERSFAGFHDGFPCADAARKDAGQRDVRPLPQVECASAIRRRGSNQGSRRVSKRAGHCRGTLRQA